jgi:putative addiction module component (TIGR02574 family)
MSTLHEQPDPVVPTIDGEACLGRVGPPPSDPGTCYSLVMDPKTSKVLKDALELPPEARAALAGSLVDSLDDDLDQDAEVAWEAEVVRRVRELNSGAPRAIPWSEARREILGR